MNDAEEFDLNSIDWYAPKRSIGFGVGGNGKTVLATWYDDVSFEPLDKKN